MLAGVILLEPLKGARKSSRTIPSADDAERTLHQAVTELESTRARVIRAEAGAAPEQQNGWH